MKRRKVKPKTPTVFSVRIKKENLSKLNDIQEHLGLDNRNMTLNHIIANYWLYELYRDFIRSLKRIIKNTGKENE